MTATISYEMSEILDCIAKEYSWNLHPSFKRNYFKHGPAFTRWYKHRRPYKKTLKPMGFLTVDPIPGERTGLFLGHPRMKLVIEEERYEEDIPFLSDDFTLPQNGRGKIDLVDPNSIELMESLFKRVDEEICDWTKTVIRRHEEGKKLAQKLRRRGKRSRNGRRNR